MDVRSVLLLVTCGISIFADPLIFAEDAREKSSSRIVSGWEAREGQFPYQLSLRMVNGSGSVSACGGTIIHPEWGLSAAHCTATRVSLIIRAGAVNLTRPEILFETTQYYNHPLYNDNLQSVVQPHDISLLRFGRAIVYSDFVQPIRLQRSEDQNKNYDGVRLTASGWGATWTQGSSPENLNWVFLSGVTNHFCWEAFSQSSIVADSTICASGYNVSTQSTCQGDSGGPLTVIDEDGQVTQVGISSFVSIFGCHVDIPAGFIRPGHYHDWYRQVTGIDFDWNYEITTTDAETEATTETETEATEAETEAATESETEATEAETEAATEAETEATEAETEATEAETEATEAETEVTETETEAATEAETEATEAETEATEAESEVTETETEAVTEIETEATEAETEAVTEAETEATEAEPESSSEENESSSEENGNSSSEENVNSSSEENADSSSKEDDREAAADPKASGFLGRFVHSIW